MMVPRRTVLAMPLFVASAERAMAQASDYPSRPVAFVVPYGPGGTTSQLAHLISQGLERRLGKPFVVENKPGAGGVTGTVNVVRALPDGYTLIMASSTLLAFDVTIFKNLPYDPQKDLTPVALLARLPFVLVVNPALPVHSVDDLVKLTKGKPGHITFATAGAGTFTHLNAELFKRQFGLDIIHVPYKGTARALTDVVGGYVQFMFADLPTALPLLQSGEVRPLGVTRLSACRPCRIFRRSPRPVFPVRRIVVAHSDHDRERAQTHR